MEHQGIYDVQRGIQSENMLALRASVGNHSNEQEMSLTQTHPDVEGMSQSKTIGWY